MNRVLQMYVSSFIGAFPGGALTDRFERKGIVPFNSGMPAGL